MKEKAHNSIYKGKAIRTPVDFSVDTLKVRDPGAMHISSKSQGSKPRLTDPATAAILKEKGKCPTI